MSVENSLATPSREGHLPQLDAIRAIAALSVFGLHAYGESVRWAFGGPGMLWSFARHGHGGLPLAFFPLAFGYVGVPIFFVLSGFCIHLAQLRSSRPFTYGRFVWRRLWRLYPAYGMAIVVATLLFGWPGRQNLLWHALMVHNFNSATLYSINASLWTLAVEWQFYLAYPLVLLAFRSMGSDRAMVVFAAVSISSLSAVTLSRHAGDLCFALNPLNSWAIWCLGAWLAERYVAGRVDRVRSWPLLAFLPLAVFLGCTQSVRVGWSYVAWGVAILPLFELAICRPRKPPAWLAWLGMISYSLYLFHQPIIAWVESRREAAPALASGFLIALPAAIALAAVNYYVVERTGITLGARLLPPTDLASKLP